MIVRRFLLWARSAPPSHRAEAIAALARAYLYSGLSSDDRWEAETALTAMLDDPSPMVRRAMAESLAGSADAPRHVVLTLAADSCEVAEIVLARSPVLLDADLVDAAALGDARVQAAIASRPYVSAGVAAALAEIGCAEALVALGRNPDAEIGHATLRRLVERHGQDAELREALLARPDLPVDVAQSIAAELARALDAFVTGCGWLSPARSERVTREACEKAAVALSAAAADDEVSRLVRHLRASAQLTPALMLRALLSGQGAFVAAAFRELTEVSPRRVAGILRDPGSGAFRALYGRTGLPASLFPAFEAGLAALRETAPAGQREAVRLSRGIVSRALAACQDLPPEEAGRLVALLRRYEAEAAREEARAVAGDLADDAALAIVLRYAPEALAPPEARPIAVAA